jgi:TonB family protein
MGPLFFDPQGADFTQWINQFRTEVYRNWMVPYAVMMFSGEVQFDFTVQRDGRVTELHMVQSAGNAALDRAARNALIAGRFLPLPADFGPPSVIMRVSFTYNARPSGS